MLNNSFIINIIQIKFTVNSFLIIQIQIFFSLFYFFYFFLFKDIFKIYGDWGLGIGDWGLGINYKYKIIKLLNYIISLFYQKYLHIYIISIINTFKKSRNWFCYPLFNF